VKTSVTGENRFENDAIRYAAYLETPEGRLRADLAFANLQGFRQTAGILRRCSLHALFGKLCNAWIGGR